MKRLVLYIVIPCHNEEECVPEVARVLSEKFSALAKSGKISARKSRVVFVDDGSSDETWKKILTLTRGQSRRFVGLKLARRCGCQNALLAGLMYARDKADAIVSIDADLQDDVNAIDKMVEKFREGYEIIYGVRKERKTDTAFKRNTAQGFYKVMKALGVELVYNAADYRLMSRRAVEALSEYGEVNLFLRGIVPTIGLRSTTVAYARAKRFAGESKYPLKKMLHFAWDGVTSFSVKPIRMVLWVGAGILGVSILVLIYALIRHLFGATVTGWTFIVCSIWLLGGIQMISIGLVGEYVGKIYAETKQRPRYIIEEVVEN